MDKKVFNKRVGFLWALVFLFVGVLTWRLVVLQVLQNDVYTAMAADQYEFFKSLVPERGEIFTADGLLLATNKKVPQIYAVPKDIKDVEKTINALTPFLKIDQEIITKRLSKLGDPYEPLSGVVDEHIAEKIKQLNLPGIKIAWHKKRYYPGGSLAAQVLGFVNQKGEGQYGVEGFFNEQLQGKKGFISGQRGALGSLVGRNVFSQAQPGEDLHLTLVSNIQFKAQQEMTDLVKKYNAKSGSVIIMDPQNGAIKALVNYPSFNPNNYNEVENIQYFSNPVVQSVYEPGSIFKCITMAAGLDSGVISSDTVYHDTGLRVYDEFEIRNWSKQAYGDQTMTQVLEKSLNTGAIFVQEQLGKKNFLHYVQKFGFELPTGIGLAGERVGDISNLIDNPVDVNYATASFGQGISVTPLQMITAISAIANGGELVQPHIIKQEKQAVGQIISPGACLSLKKMMVSAFKQGAKQAQVPGYEIAGKTGTAQIAQAGGYSNEFIHSFVGFAPSDNPSFVILIKLDQPQGVRFAATSLSPVFKNLAQFLFNYYQIPPST